MNKEVYKKILCTTGYIKEVDKHAVLFHIERLEEKIQKAIAELGFEIAHNFVSGGTKHRLESLLELLEGSDNNE